MKSIVLACVVSLLFVCSVFAQAPPGPAPPPPRLDSVVAVPCDCYIDGSGAMRVIVNCFGYSTQQGIVKYFYSVGEHWHQFSTDQVEYEFEEGAFTGLTAGFKEAVISNGGVWVCVQLFHGSNYVTEHVRFVAFEPLVIE